MSDPKKPSDWTKEEIEHKVEMSALFFWLVGCCVIFTVGCVTYYYVGPIFEWEGQVGFQVSGLIVAGIIAHYTFRIFRFVNNVGKEDSEDEELQEGNVR